MDIKVIYGNFVGGQWLADDVSVFGNIESVSIKDGVLKLVSAEDPDDLVLDISLSNVFSLEFPV